MSGRQHLDSIADAVAAGELAEETLGGRAGIAALRGEELDHRRALGAGRLRTQDKSAEGENG